MGEVLIRGSAAPRSGYVTFIPLPGAPAGGERRAYVRDDGTWTLTVSVNDEGGTGYRVSEWWLRGRKGLTIILQPAPTVIDWADIQQGEPGGPAYQPLVLSVNGMTGHVLVGSTGGGAARVHEQVTPAATWSITHDLGRLPNVAVYVDGQEIITDVEASATQVVLTFPAPTAGSAVLT